MKKTVALIFILCLVIQMTYAQKRTLTGTVRDKTTSEPLPGVTIIEKGTTNGTITDVTGNFKVSITPESVLVVSFIGMTSKEIKPGKSTNLIIELETSIQEMSEVVVVGFGTQKKANLTGAVASVNTKMLEARPIADVGRGLQGTTPGLSVVIPSGEVGSDPIMKIRGQLASFQGGSAPLLLMDNVEIPSIQMVNPDDIESISVLKDAASASIYGAKGAFGVVLITTKRGAKTESVNVSYSGNLSFQNISKKMEMGGVDALEYTVSAFERVGGIVGGAFWQVTREGYEKAKVWQDKWGGVVKPNDPMLYGRDWFVDASNRKIGLRTYDPYNYMVKEWAPTKTHNLSVNGKSGKTDYNMSF
ncbi:MAG TPA: carboxypeptidase-like regulatory domain-containing protein, partial [Prolixibacteraceae bacterium]